MFQAAIDFSACSGGEYPYAHFCSRHIRRRTFCFSRDSVLADGSGWAEGD